MFKKGFNAVLSMMLAAALCFGLYTTAAFAEETSDTMELEVTGTYNYAGAYEVLDMVNEERTSEGVDELTMDQELMDAAMQRAAECSVSFGHTRPSGEDCFTVSSKATAENIAMGQNSAGAVMADWMSSTGHSKNILESSYKSVGIGCFVKDGTTYWVQFFSRNEASVAAQPANREGTTSVVVSRSVLPELFVEEEESVADDPEYSAVNEEPEEVDASVEEPDTKEDAEAEPVDEDIVEENAEEPSSDTEAVDENSEGSQKVDMSAAEEEAEDEPEAEDIEIEDPSMGIATFSAKASESSGSTSASSSSKSSSSKTTSVTKEVKKASDGNWYYYENGVKQTGYTGFATNSSGKWYVEKGKVTKKTNGVFKDATGAIGAKNNWYYVTNSKVQTGFTGLAHYKNSSGWWYITNGKVDRSYTGLAKNQNGWFYVKNGKVDRSYTGFAKNSSGKWYVEKGKVTKKTNGVFKDSKGAIGSKNNWYYVTGSKVQTGFTGLANYKNDSGWWYITKGKVDRSYNGIAKNKNGSYYVKNGKVDRSYSGTYTSGNTKYTIVNGKVTKTANVSSSSSSSLNGVCKASDGNWYYYKNGVKQTSYTGIQSNSNGTWYIKNGKVDKSYSGTKTFDGIVYTIKNGKVTKKQQMVAYDDYIYQGVWGCNMCGYPLFTVGSNGATNLTNLYEHPEYNGCTGGAWHNEQYVKERCYYCGDVIEYRCCQSWKKMAPQCAANTAESYVKVEDLSDGGYPYYKMYYKVCSCGKNQSMSYNGQQVYLKEIS